MKDAMISVRIPSTLVQELKEIAESNHYLDLSEQIRDIIRIKCSTQLTNNSEPELLNEKSNDKEKLVQNLQALLEQLKKDM